jgi:glycine hydroxymethyltransferase
MCHITVNKVAIFSENGVISPGGVRIGSPAMTSRGCLEPEFETMADFLYRAAQIASAAQREHGKLQKEPLKSIYHCKEIADLRNQVEAFATQFAMPAFDM